MTNREFYDRLAKTIMDECWTEEAFIEVYKQKQQFDNEHDVTLEDTEYYRNSGAAEILAMATQSYRRRMKK